MFQQLVIRVKTREFQLYNEYFSFFHSNSINKILTSKKIDQVILYRDLQFFDDETEYLKRAYYETEAYNRIKKLISYYEKNMTPPSPLLLTVEQYQYLDNRNRKILKLCIMKEKSQGQKERRKSFMQSNGLKVSNLSAVADILPKLEQSNLENIADSDRDESEEESYDSDVHNVFQNFKEKARSLFADGNDNSPEYKEVLGIRNVKESELVINFKTANEPPSDFNNAENQPKILVSEPPSGITGLKFSNTNKTTKQQENKVLQQQNYQSYQNQAQKPQVQSSFHTQTEPTIFFQQGYQGNGFSHQGLHQVQNNTMYQQVQIQSFPNSVGYEASPSQNMGPSMMSQNQGQYRPGYSNNGSEGNYQPAKQSCVKTVSNQPLFQPQPSSQTYQPQPSTTNSSNQQGNPFTNMMMSSSYNNSSNNFQNYSSSGSGNSNCVNSSLQNNNSNKGIPSSTSANNINSPTKMGIATATSPNKKGKTSFMEYYHSVPVKNPTNILEKYMKRKK